MIKYSIRKISETEFNLSFANLTADETADLLVSLRRFQRTREGTVTSPKAMIEFLGRARVGFSFTERDSAAKG